ncbi:ribose 1,5-bisphosphate isomerase [Methanomassiliicoccus luminyensis]|uniref:ribose 1,5-bisphosphate isomerase n=1 Tax=Methanomassiliicoccus luminyensis TaxID=1080712 RepID=UPI0003683CBD|nr:ribose 1,5-bisphosphate isomerase [Methanomassiliicoccus luminyensis]
MGVIEIADSIKTMKVRGAGLIARSAAEALKQQALDYQGDDLGKLRKLLADGQRTLVDSRPTAISLWNAVQATMRGTSGAESAADLRDLVVKNADSFVARSSRAVEVIGRIGSRRIRDGDTVLTHCNSKAALGVIKAAHADGKKIKVYATESRPWRQGLLTVRDLAAAGVPSTLIIDSAVRWIMKDIDVVVVGADTVCSNGALINKVGTSQVALAAREARVPFIVCAETYKFSPKTMHGELVEIEERDASEVIDPKLLPEGVGVRNPVFDATPPELIDSIVTEIGLISPYAAYEVIVKEIGPDSLFETED